MPNPTEKGAATLLITTLMLVSITMIVLFAANYSLMQQKISTSANRNQQAYEAAEAGLEFGINYLNENNSVILANPISGFIQPYTSSATTNVSLANGSKFTILYTNPIANNYNVIQVTSTGTNDDSSSTKIISQQVAFGSLLYVAPAFPITVKGSVNLSDFAAIQNTSGATTVHSGLSTSITNLATTVSSTSSSSAILNGSDIQQNLSALANMTTNDFFSSYFGISSTAAKNKAFYTYSNLSNYNSVLDGKTGTTIWIDQDSGSATIDGNTQIGSVTQPVLLFINGNLNLSDQVTITGLVVMLGTSPSSINGHAQIIGGLLAVGNLNMSFHSIVTYNPTILNTLRNVTNRYYAKVPGSWNDF